MSLLASHPFPTFVRDLPHRQSIYQLLASLQAQNHLNSNVLLYCVWFALSEQGRLRRPEFKKLETVLHPWHDRIVVALQQLTNSLADSRTMRQWIAVEADIADQFEQQMLAQAFSTVKKSRRNALQQLTDACHNLATYYKVMRINADENIYRTTLKILHLLFVDCTDAQITQSFDQALNAARLDDSGFTQLSLSLKKNLPKNYFFCI